MGVSFAFGASSGHSLNCSLYTSAPASFSVLRWHWFVVSLDDIMIVLEWQKRISDRFCFRSLRWPEVLLHVQMCCHQNPPISKTIIRAKHIANCEKYHITLTISHTSFWCSSGFNKKKNLSTALQDHGKGLNLVNDKNIWNVKTGAL